MRAYEDLRSSDARATERDLISGKNLGERQSGVFGVLIVVDGAENARILSAKFVVLPRAPGLQIVAAETKVSIEFLPVALAPAFEEMVNLKANRGVPRDKRPAAAFHQPNANYRGGVNTGFRCEGIEQASKPSIDRGYRRFDSAASFGRMDNGLPGSGAAIRSLSSFRNITCNYRPDKRCLPCSISAKSLKPLEKTTSINL